MISDSKELLYWFQAGFWWKILAIFSTQVEKDSFTQDEIWPTWSQTEHPKTQKTHKNLKIQFYIIMFGSILPYVD